VIEGFGLFSVPNEFEYPGGLKSDASAMSLTIVSTEFKLLFCAAVVPVAGAAGAEVRLNCEVWVGVVDAVAVLADAEVVAVDGEPVAPGDVGTGLVWLFAPLGD
jgi:hypothetical protein